MPLWQPKEEFAVVGRRVRMVDGVEKVTGRAKYADDMDPPPHLLYAKILRSPHAHARILEIDTSAGKKLEGVKAIITADDLPPIPNENPADPIIARDKVTFENQAVAIVAAEDLLTCKKALDLIRVRYELLTPVFDAEEAMKPDAPNVYSQYPTNTDAGWLGDPCDLTRGDVEKGFEEADLILEDRFKVTLEVNASPEIRTIMAHWTDAGLTLWFPEQQLHWDRKVIAQALSLPLSRVRIICPYSGGGYGAANKSKGTDDPRILTALLSKTTGRPVKCIFTRREELINGRGRHQNTAYVRLGVRKDGRITALDVRNYYDTGGTNEMGYVVSTYGTYSQMSLHGIPNVRARTWLVLTNNTPGEEYRSFGNVQSMFPVESLVDQAAYELGLDPAEIRLKNHITAGFTWGAKRTDEIESAKKVKLTAAEIAPSPNALPKAVRGIYLSGIEPGTNPDQVIAGPKPLSSSALGDCIKEGMDRIGWREKWHPAGAVARGSLKHGIGMAIFLLPTGLFSTEAIVRVNIRGGVFVPHGAANIGTAASNAVGQVVAEILGFPFDDVKVHWGDTDTTPYDSMTAASRVAATTCNAYAIAAQDAKRQILEAAAPELGTVPENLEIKNRRIFLKDDPEKGELMEKLLSGQYDKEFVGRGYYRSEAQPLIPLATGAHFVELEVDAETGYLQVQNVVVAVDSGVPINVDVVEGQAQGGFLHGMSYALGDHIIVDKATGRIVNGDFYNYKIVTAPDCPRIETLIIDAWDPLGKVGQKGIGEIHLIGAPIAIGNALYNALGVRVKELPFTPQNILKALGKLPA